MRVKELVKLYYTKAKIMLSIVAGQLFLTEFKFIKF